MRDALRALLDERASTPGWRVWLPRRFAETRAFQVTLNAEGANVEFKGGGAPRAGCELALVHLIVAGHIPQRRAWALCMRVRLLLVIVCGECAVMGHRERAHCVIFILL